MPVSSVIEDVYYHLPPARFNPHPGRRGKNGPKCVGEMYIKGQDKGVDEREHEAPPAGRSEFSFTIFLLNVLDLCFLPGVVPAACAIRERAGASNARTPARQIR